ncbi:MAG: hypothetical protein ACRELS_19515 [Candidatus Rokuibacteriota bacterium]
MFFGTFAWAFVFISLPFHIQRVSPWDPVTTLRWMGWILGISPLLTVTTAPFWGRYAERANVKALYVLTQLLAWSSSWILYVVLALIGLASLPLAVPRPATAAGAR